MNPVVIVHLLAAALVIGASIPLIRRRVKMNHWYGVRIPAAFISEERWYQLNQYGGRLFLYWGLAMGVTAIVGAFLDQKDWITYNWAAVVIALGGLAMVIVGINRYARKGDTD